MLPLTGSIPACFKYGTIGGQTLFFASLALATVMLMGTLPANLLIIFAMKSGLKSNKRTLSIEIGFWKKDAKYHIKITKGNSAMSFVYFRKFSYSYISNFYLFIFPSHRVRLDFCDNDMTLDRNGRLYYFSCC